MPPLKFLAFFIVLFSAKLCAQTSIVDSLSKKLEKSKGIERVNILNQLTFEYLSQDNEKAMNYCDQAISLGNDLNYLKGVGQAYTYKGVYEYLSGEYSDGRGNLMKGLNLAVKANDRANQGYTLLQLGNSFMNLGQMDSALIYYTKSYEILKDSSNATNLSKLYRNMSILYGLRSSLDMEKKYLVRSLQIREKMKNKTLITEALVMLARVNIRERDYVEAEQNLTKANRLLVTNPDDQENLNDWRHQKALILLQENRIEEALVLFDSAISYFSSKSLLPQYVVVQSDLGKFFNDRGEYEIALKCFEDALKVAQSKGHDIEIADINLQIGWADFRLGDRTQAMKLANKTLLWAEKNSVIRYEADAQLLRGFIFSMMAEFDQAKTCFDRSYSIALKLKDNTRISQIYEAIGFMELKKENYAASLENYTKSLRPAELSNYQLGMVWSLCGLGNVYVKLGQFQKALSYFDASEKTAIRIKARAPLAIIYEGKTNLFKTQKNYQQALHYAQLELALGDSLHRTAVGQKFGSLQRFQEVLEKEREIQILAQERVLTHERLLLQETRLNQQFYFILLGLTLIVVLSALAFVYARFYFRVKRLNLAINQQKEKLQTQANYINQLNKNLESNVAEKTMELQKANQELIKQNDELLQFSYSVSHNLRGPVARMIGLTNIYRLSKDTSEHDIMMDYVHKASQDLDSILRDLSKLLDVRNDLHNLKEWVDLEDEWKKSCSLLEGVIQDDFQITYDFASAPKIFTIKAFIQSLFYNLLSNAIKYRSDSRTLVITASLQLHENDCYIEVTDNGLGIDVEKHKDSLFKLFKRFHTHVEGRGLGLYLIKSQIESLNGSLLVNSVIDHKTTFTAMIPGVLSNESKSASQK